MALVLPSTAVTLLLARIFKVVVFFQVLQIRKLVCTSNLKSSNLDQMQILFLVILLAGMVSAQSPVGKVYFSGSFISFQSSVLLSPPSEREEEKVGDRLMFLGDSNT